MNGNDLGKSVGLHSLKNRIVAGYICVICILVTLVLYSYYSVSRINDIHLLKEHSLRLQKSLSEIKCASSQFILNDPTNLVFFETGSSIYIENYNKAYSTFSSTLDSTILISESFDNNTTELKKLKNDIEVYNKKFNEVKTKIKSRGFGKYGIVGDFEKAMIQLTQYDFGLDNVALSNMQLYVKEYLLSGDTTAVQLLDEEMYNFSLLLEKHISDNKIDAVANLLNNYSETFNKLVDIDNELGKSNSQSGLEQELFFLISAIDKNLERENHIQEEFHKTLNKRIFGIYAVVILLSIGIVLAISLYLPKIISKPINAIKEDIIKIGNGDLPDHVEISNMKEIGEMAIALNNTIEGLKEKSIFADSIGNGKFDATINVVNENDILTQSLIRMRDNLKKVAEEDQQRIWITKGSTQFMEILRANDGNLQELSRKIISILVKHLHANIGGLFLVSDDAAGDPTLKLTGCYAYDQLQTIDKTIAFGEGIVGQAALKKESIYITEIPKNYIWITSGLGNSIPKFMFVVPVKINNKIYGVIELASFHAFEQFQMDFIEDLASNIAAAVSGININERSKKLLTESQDSADAMSVREVEMNETLDKLNIIIEEQNNEIEKIRQEDKELKAQKDIQQDIVKKMQEKIDALQKK